ncbi:MAG: ABC transporter permease [Acidobacteriia bacterium]|nr:ABC transporter permease [Terriglobia bacterium]
MTLARFVYKNTFRNKRRSILTVLSISFSLLLLTLMITVYRGFYIDQGPADSALRLITRHRVSLNFFMPSYYREKIRAVPGVVQVSPLNWFGGIYKDTKPENFFAQFGTDPQEIFKVHNEWKIPSDQLTAWQRDRAGTVVSTTLAKKYGWKIGDRLVIKGNIFPVDLELTIRGIFDAGEEFNSLLFDKEYVEEAVAWAKGQAGTFAIRVASPDDVSRVAAGIDDTFRNSPAPTRTESEKDFLLEFVAMMGNVKAFILSIALAVTFAILLVSANTMAMSVRERIREVAILKTLGFTQSTVLVLFVAEAMFLALVGGLLGAFAAKGLIAGASHSPMGDMMAGMRVTGFTFVISLGVAALVGFASAFVPAFRASRLNIVEGLRHIG